MVVGGVIGFAMFPGAGWDWYNHFAVFALRPTMDVLHPAWIYLVITPLTWLPGSWAFIAFTVLNGGLLIATISMTQSTNGKIIILGTLPVLWVLMYGQIDAWVAFGAMIGLWAIKNQKPYWVGVGVLMLTTKVHIGAPLAILFLVYARNWKTLLVPTIVYGASFLAFGFWPVTFIHRLFTMRQNVLTTQVINVSLWPFGVALFLIMLVIWKHQSLQQYTETLLATTALAMPYTGAYSLLTTEMTLEQSEWWLLLLLIPAWLGPQWASLSGQTFCIAVILWNVGKR